MCSGISAWSQLVSKLCFIHIYHPTSSFLCNPRNLRPPTLSLSLCVYSARSNKDSVAAVEGGAADDAVSVSSVLTTQSTDLEPALSGRHALHKAVLEIIYSLSSDVSLKKNSQGLNQ